jgi:hypothetical protein
MMKNKEVNDGAPIETTVAGNMENIVDIEVARIAAESQPDSSCHDGSSRNAEEGREEV